MSRISYRRTTPEGWQETIRRMVTLNKAPIDPADARVIVKYLSDNLGLAPEEAKPGAFESERRLIDHTYAANTDTAGVCSSCHSMGRVILQRRSRGGLGPARRHASRLVSARGQPGVPPLRPAEHDAWSRRPAAGQSPSDGQGARAPEVGVSAEDAGMVGVVGDDARAPHRGRVGAERATKPGEGPIAGRVTIAPGAAPDEFTTDDDVHVYARSGRAVTRTGRMLIYTGYQWRGRTTVGGDDSTSLREVMFVDRDWQSIAGRWFTGDYDELGMDVTLTRIGREPIVSGLDRRSLGAGRPARHSDLRLQTFPRRSMPRDVDFGPWRDGHARR